MGLGLGVTVRVSPTPWAAHAGASQRAKAAPCKLSTTITRAYTRSGIFIHEAKNGKHVMKSR